MNRLDEGGLAQPPEKPAPPPAEPTTPPAEASPVVVHVAPEVSVGCAYCKGRLVRPEAVYCAACLAPHHHDCWTDHGKCAACAADTMVRAERSPRRARGVGVAAATIAALGLGIGLVALPPSRTASVEAPRLASPVPTETSLPAVPTSPAPAPAPAKKSSGPDVGDTIRIRRQKWRVTRLVPEGGFVARQWLGDGWGEESTVPSDTLYVPVELEKRTTVGSAAGSVQLELGILKQGPRSRVRLVVSVLGQDRILRSGRVALPGRDPIELGPLLPGDTRTEHPVVVDLDGPLAELTDLDFVPVASPEGKRIIARVLASKPALDPQLAGTAVACGDPQLALALAHRLGEEDRKIVDDVFAGFAERGADALLEHLSVESDHYGLMTPTKEGTLVWKTTSDAVALQRRELELLDGLPIALRSGRAFTLFQISQGRTLARDELLDVAKNHLEDLMEAIASDARFVEGGNEDAVAAFFAGLGEDACSALARRVASLDPVLATSIRSRRMLDMEPVKYGLARLRQDLSSRRGKP